MATLYPLNVKCTVFTTSGTWTKDPRTKQMLVETLGGGGGSRVSGTGGNGGTSSFGALVSASGGQGAGASGAAGAAASLATDRFSFPGGKGQIKSYVAGVIANSNIGSGGGCFFGPPRFCPGAGYNAGATGWVASAETNPGCGASTSSGGTTYGGGGGAYTAQVVEAEEAADSVTVTVGAGGSAGTSGFVGGAGLVIVTEFF